MTLLFLVGVVVCIIALVFVCAWIYELHKAQKRLETHGTPIDHGRIVKESFVAALTVGLGCCLAGAKAEAQQNNGGSGGDVEAQQGGHPPMADVPQMPQGPQPGMDWTPVTNAAQDGVQG